MYINIYIYAYMYMVYIIYSNVYKRTNVGMSTCMIRDRPKNHGNAHGIYEILDL